MTPAEEQARIESAVVDIDAELRAAQVLLMERIRAGDDPRQAVQAAVASFAGPMEATLTAAFADVLSASVGQASTVALIVGSIHLSARLYAEAQTTSDVVAGIVQRHVRGFLDARTLALELFQGYAFRPPDAEPLQLSPSNPRLPQYLREVLAADAGIHREMARAFARIQVDNLSTPALQAAYNELIAAIDALEAGAGAAAVERRIEIAFFERMRYFATRIARTELHKAYAEREALLLMQDVEVEFVQIRRAPGRQLPCVCTLLTGRDLYGLGPGVYPKALAPVAPYHPHCMCSMSPRLDLTGRTATDRDAEGDVYFLRRLDAPIAARVMGSRARLDQVLQGRPADQVVNSTRDPAYRVRTIGEVVG